MPFDDGTGLLHDEEIGVVYILAKLVGKTIHLGETTVGFQLVILTVAYAGLLGLEIEAGLAADFLGTEEVALKGGVIGAGSSA